MPEESLSVSQPEIPLLGGNTSTVVRVGATVRRNAGPWTPSVHALLRHLEYVGFTGAPHALGIDERGREVLSYLEGECGEYPLAPHWVTDEALVAVARMLRMFHDAQYGFRPARGAVWRSFGPPPPDTEVICHHDAAPHNVIWRPDGTLAMIDFDLASPGTRLYDVAYAAWTWVPLFTDRDSYTLGWTRPSRPRRLRLFADAYGLTPRDRQRLLGTVRRRIVDHVEGIRRMAAAGEPAFVRIVRQGHLRRPARDLRLIDHERLLLEHALR
ncbi:aminoglycoside phosphotransferase family protein [Planosporangium thailandense]|uniref:Aminoglycoside phosphotransferase family protein n=1 Tax=Planosporangium thailandense TaxID=765197 RepID=A0ABX0XSG6_9ACTN|nr:aminoglycoside phosphotransferase family protein [Planosporangium thailandense]NJC68179.1 aminoglycoside phosphotransferase family protein [Planosporangium thailandense]